MSNLTQLFTSIGGDFMTTEAELIEKLKHIKAFVFDWDGVFTDGGKDSNLQSKFNEADSMGTNLLRFSYFLNQQSLPITAIISGEKNEAAFTFIDRERFHASYSKFGNKLEAANHLCTQNNISLNQICYMFDDVLDLCLAEVVGIKIFIPRKHNPLFNSYVVKHKLADYITGATCGQYAVREACELLIGLNNNFETVIAERVTHTENYKNYLALRKAINPIYYTTQSTTVVEVKELNA